jgi:transcriptional regulator with XRE-family HTH domain
MRGMKAHSHVPKEMMPTTSHLGPVLKRHREELNLSREEVAEKANITPLALFDLETGRSSSRSDTYERVALAMNLCYPLVVWEAFVDSQNQKGVFIVEFNRLMELVVLK